MRSILLAIIMIMLALIMLQRATDSKNLQHIRVLMDEGVCE